jgi:hypothetical protein
MPFATGLIERVIVDDIAPVVGAEKNAVAADLIKQAVLFNHRYRATLNP